MSDVKNPIIREYAISICDPCIRLEGRECHTPGCVFCRHTIREIGEYLDVLMLRPVVDGKRLDLARPIPLSDVIEALNACRYELRHHQKCEDECLGKADAALEKAGLGDGIVGDPDHPCEQFAVKAGFDVFRDCNGDGHYLCSQCAHFAKGGSRA